MSDRGAGALGMTGPVGARPCQGKTVVTWLLCARAALGDGADAA